MFANIKARRFIAWLGVALLQLIMIMVANTLFTMPFPGGMEDYPQTHPVQFVVVLGISILTGVCLTGWWASKRRWITIRPKYLARLVCTLIGAFVPLLLALRLYDLLEPGNPFFFISMLTGVAGFYLPGWIKLE
jgi:hypothetical protein